MFINRSNGLGCRSGKSRVSGISSTKLNQVFIYFFFFLRRSVTSSDDYQLRKGPSTSLEARKAMYVIPTAFTLHCSSIHSVLYLYYMHTNKLQCKHTLTITITCSHLIKHQLVILNNQQCRRTLIITTVNNKVHKHNF